MLGTLKRDPKTSKIELWSLASEENPGITLQGLKHHVKVMMVKVVDSRSDYQNTHLTG